MMLLAAVVGCSTPRPPSNPSSSSVFTVELVREGVEIGCLATRVARTWAVTAGHCWSGPVTAMRVRCQGSGLQRTTGIVRGLAHPVYDVALLHFPWPIPCEGTPIMVAERSTGGRDYTLLHIEANRRCTHSVQASSGSHTLTVRASGLCLARGQSGAPLLLEVGRAEFRLAGLLIAGAPGCDGPDTFVRLDRLRPWIRDQIAHFP
ncbi:MAG: hypothetical protein R3202_14215 [Candidatus Competibacterales bacterium]|nr:hypothetical protein [Candidatus Competibacterales bacterium]